MQFLQAMQQHGSVVLLQHVAPNVHTVVWIYAEDVAIERTVVHPAQGQAIRHLRSATLILVGQDMSGIEQFSVRKPTNGTTFAVRRDDKLSEPELVQALHHYTGGIASLPR